MRAVRLGVTVGVPDGYSDEEVRQMVQKQLEKTDGDITNPEVLL